MIILKIGGSLITDRTKTTPTPNKGNIKRLASEIAKSKVRKIIIIHGAGSYGHPIVKKYNLIGHINKAKKEQKIKLAINQILKLNTLFLNKLLRNKLCAVPIHIEDLITAKKGRIIKFPLKEIKALIKNGKIPVLYGTLVKDKVNNFSVISGDAILGYLGKKIHPKLAIHATDVDGFLADGKVIKKIKSLKQIKKHLNGSKNIDVTGGMKNKIEEIFKNKVKTQIINGNTSDNVLNALKGSRKIGTMILP